LPCSSAFCQTGSLAAQLIWNKEDVDRFRRFKPLSTAGRRTLRQAPQTLYKSVGCNFGNRTNLDFLPIFGTFDKI
jgi:hypothetical protein